MQAVQYAVVAYLRNELGRFVEELRTELHPQHAHLPAHVTVLPPRPLQGSEAQGVETLEALCRDQPPFEISLGQVETFSPTTPTVFIQVERAGYRLRELHDRLNTGVFQFEEPWPYMPHLTVVKLSDLERALTAFESARQRWANYRGPRHALVDQLAFVRELPGYRWEDLAPVQLGTTLAKR